MLVVASSSFPPSRTYVCMYMGYIQYPYHDVSFIHSLIHSFTGDHEQNWCRLWWHFIYFYSFVRRERLGELMSIRHHVVQFYLLVRCKLENIFFFYFFPFISVYSLVVNEQIDITWYVLFYLWTRERSNRVVDFIYFHFFVRCEVEEKNQKLEDA